MSPERIERRRRVLLALFVVLALGSAGLGVLAYEIDLFAPYELSTVDTRFAIRGTQRAPGIVIVGIDDATLLNAGRTLGNPPYPRKDDARVIDRVLADGAKAVAVDLQFSEPSTKSQDLALVHAIDAAHGKAIVASTAVGAQGSTPIFDWVSGWRGPVGFTGFEPDSDGKIRTYPYDVFAGQPGACCLANFAVATLEQATTHRTFPRSDFPGGSAPIDFAGPPGTFRVISYVAVSGSPANGYRATFRPGTFRNKIVIVGATDTVLQDVHTVATGTLMSGPEIWANAIWSLEHGNPLRDAPGGVDIALIVLLGLVMPLARLRLRLALAIDLAVALGIAYAGATQLGFDAGVILPVTYPLFSLLVGTVSSNAADALFERSHRLTLQAELARLPGASATFFVSYRREQSSWPAGILTSALTERFGEDSVFKDTESISAGEEWPQRIEDAINGCDVMLVLIGPRWIEAAYPDGRRRLDDPDDWVRREIETGLSSPCAVVPVLLDGSRMPDDDGLPPSLRALAHRNAYSLTPEHWDTQLIELLASIQEGRIRSFLAAEAAAEASPPGGTTPPAGAPSSAAPPLGSDPAPGAEAPAGRGAAIRRPVPADPPAHTAIRSSPSTPPVAAVRAAAPASAPVPVPPPLVLPAPSALAAPVPAAARQTAPETAAPADVSGPPVPPAGPAASAAANPSGPPIPPPASSATAASAFAAPAATNPAPDMAPPDAPAATRPAARPLPTDSGREPAAVDQSSAESREATPDAPPAFVPYPAGAPPVSAPAPDTSALPAPAPAAPPATVPAPDTSAIATGASAGAGTVTRTPLGRREDATTSTTGPRSPDAPAAPRAAEPAPASPAAGSHTPPSPTAPAPAGSAPAEVLAAPPAHADADLPASPPPPPHPRIPRRPR